MHRDLTNDVIRFVSEYLAVSERRISVDMTIFGDLGVDGDDGAKLLEAFGERFHVDMIGCDPRRHFGPESDSLLAPIRWLGRRFRPWSAGTRDDLKPIRVSDLVRIAEAGHWAS